jgi:transposase-like protein
VDTIMSTTNTAPRRRTYTTEFRQGLVAQYQPGVSVSRIALAHGINANLLRKWIDRYRNQLPAPVSAEPSKLVTVQVELPAKDQTEAACSETIEISLTKRTTHINIRWPGNQAQACATWLSAWLK